MCGLCLPHCPTYVKTRNEAESPRGRISLISALLADRLPLTDKLESHLSNCLSCRACEDVCPSEVAYGALMDGARAVIETRRQRPWLQRTLRRLGLTVITHKRVFRLAASALRVYQRIGLQNLMLRLGLFKRLNGLLPPLTKASPLHAYYPSKTQQHTRGDVALFTGCVSAALDRQTIDAAIALLTHCGYGVYVPPQQTCCGALHQHDGEPASAERLAAKNVKAFDLPVDAVLSAVSGCSARLLEYPAPMGEKVRDISEFLATTPWPEGMKLRPLNQRVVVHDPCSLVRVLHQQHHAYALLKRVPGIELLPLPGNMRCCGAAGSYMLTHAAMADELLADKLDAITTTQADILVTSNVGCALHMMRGVRGMGSALEIVHPIVLLARQLEIDSPAPLDNPEKTGILMQ